MRYPVTFFPSKFSPFAAYGRGTIHVHDVALRIEGRFPRFAFPVWINNFLQSLMSDRSTRTIPYSKIVAVRAPKLLRRSYGLLVRTPAGDETWVQFQVEKRLAKQLLDLIEQNREVARTLRGG